MQEKGFHLVSVLSAIRLDTGFYGICGEPKAVVQNIPFSLGKDGILRLYKWLFLILLLTTVSTGSSLADSIGTVKTFPEGTPVTIDDAVVTAVDVEPGCVFVESSNRSAGIKVVTSDTALRGQRVKVTGKVRRVDGEWQIAEGHLANPVSAAVPAPLGMTTGSITNHGLDTTGLVVRICGLVTGINDADRIVYVDDRGGYRDGLTIGNRTTLIDYAGNLDSLAQAGYSVTTFCPLYDSRGIPHILEVKFTKTANQCEWTYTISSSESTPSVIATGVILFDIYGLCNTDLVDLSMNLTTPNGSPNPIIFQLSLSGISQLVGIAGTSTVRMVYQNGMPALPTEGIRVKIPANVTMPGYFNWIIVTGISRVEKVTLESENTVVYIPSVWVRDESDIIRQISTMF